jgi:hypothetical protein
MGLVRVRGRQAKEEVDYLAGVRPAVAVVSEEDDERGLEVLWVDEGLEGLRGMYRGHCYS